MTTTLMPGTAPELLSDGWLEALAEALTGIEVPEVADGVVQVTVRGASGGRSVVFHIIVGECDVCVVPGRYRDPDAVLVWAFADFEAVWRGDLSVEEAYMDGMLKIDGDRVLLIDGWRSVRTSSEVVSALKTLCSTAE